MGGFIRSIINFLKSLFGLGKQSEYFMELDDAGNDGAASAAPVAVGKPEPVASTSAPAAPKQSAKKSTPAEVPLGTANVSPKDLIVAAINQAKAAEAEMAKEEKDPEVGFASNFELLMSVENGRRTPGPSMNSFLNMARSTPSARR